MSGCDRMYKGNTDLLYLNCFLQRHIPTQTSRMFESDREVRAQPTEYARNYARLRTDQNRTLPPVPDFQRNEKHFIISQTKSLSVNLAFVGVFLWTVNLAHATLTGQNVSAFLLLS